MKRPFKSEGIESLNKKALMQKEKLTACLNVNKKLSVNLDDIKSLYEVKSV